MWVAVQRYFSQAFKEHFRISPAAFRKARIV